MNEKDAYAELSSIRDLMERSSKFISLSGLSGILAGVYAIAGACLAYRNIKYSPVVSTAEPYLNDQGLLQQLIMIALGVFILSVLTSYWLTLRKAKRRNENIWNPVSRRMLVAIAIPMITGGLFIGILLIKEHYIAIPSACLIFYGLALVAGSQYTFNDVKWLGIGEITLGLLALSLPGHGLLLWTIGFGVLHIIYGAIMHFKYER